MAAKAQLTRRAIGTSDLYVFLGAHMKAIRRNLGVTQTQVGEELDMTPSAISYLERGKTRPSIEVLLAWCKVLGQDPADVMRLLVRQQDVARRR